MLKTLKTHRRLHKFLADERDLSAWVTDMKKQIQADDLAKDVAGAEALVERHHEHKYEIDAREDAFHALGQAGEELLVTENVPKEDITECLMNLAQVYKYKYICE